MTEEQELRLTCLAEANDSHGHRPTGEVIDRANAFAEFMTRDDRAALKAEHEEECRKHAWMLSKAHANWHRDYAEVTDQLHYERNLVGVLTERLDERDADYKRLAGMHQAQAETIGKLQREVADLAQLAADRLRTIAGLRRTTPAGTTNTRGGIWS